MKSTIRIQELSHNSATNTFQVRLTFRYDGDEDSMDNIAFPNLHTEATEDLMEGYFEKFISTPYDDVPYQSVVQKIEQYGEDLFTAFFSSNQAFRFYYNILQSCAPENIVIEIKSQSPAFQAIYWESMKAPDDELPLAAQGVVFRRKSTTARDIKAEVKPSPYINLLIVTARPSEDQDVAYRTIQRPLIELIKQSKLRVKAHILRPGTYEAFLKHLDEVGAKNYHIIHFDLHGSLMDYANYERYYQQAEKADFQRHLFKNPLFRGNYALTELTPYAHKKAFLFFESRQKGVAVPVEAEQLAKVLKQQQVPIIILNACQSAKQDHKDSSNETSLGRILIQQGIQLVLAMRYSVSVSAAKLMMEVLYQQIYSHKGIEKAIAQARKELYRYKTRRAAYNRAIPLEDWILPVVYQNRPPKLQLRAFTGDEKAAFVQSTKIPHSLQQHLPYGFFGRDLDILQIEKALLTQRNILLLQGMGGAGKTTLLKYLGKWWLQTGFVEQVFYFGYDEKAYTKTDILNSIARQIYGEVGLAQWRMQSEAVKEYDIIQAFNAHSYALILDNAESITGAKLAIQHTLNESQRHELHQFLQQLSGGQSKILIGSRSDESWLKAGTFGSNHLILSGLDREAAKNFADKIISELNIPIEYIAKDGYFSRLLKFLAGYPLALKAVLPNLRNKTSKRILEELDKGLEVLDKGNPQKRTESIVKCIEYAHSNLSEDAQKLLLCLAPFVGVVNVTPDWLQDYFDELAKHAQFKNYHFDKLSIVVQEAVRNGFMQKIDIGLNIKMVQIQPVFTFFVRNKLKENGKLFKILLNNAYTTYYLSLGVTFAGFITSKKSQEQQIGELLITLEYENLYRALFMQLEKQGTIMRLLTPIYEYLKKRQWHQKRLELTEKVYNRVKQYDTDNLQGSVVKELIGAYDMFAHTFFTIKSLNKAKSAWLEIINIYENSPYLKLNLEPALATIYQSLGAVYREERNSIAAKSYYEKALCIYKQHKDIYGEADIYQNLGIVCKDEQEYGRAKTYFEKASTIFELHQYTFNQGKVYHELGAVYAAESDYFYSKKCYKKSLHIYMLYQEVNLQGRIYNDLGTVHLTENNYGEARDCFKKALAKYEESEDSYSQALVYQNLGATCNREKKYGMAIKYFEKALIILMTYKDVYYVLNLLGAIINLPKEGNYKAFVKSMLDKANKVYQDNKEVLTTLELFQQKINKI